MHLQSELAERQRVEQALQRKDEELRTISQQLWQAAKLATMGELAASIAHELNNPLATVTLRVESLLEQAAELARAKGSPVHEAHVNDVVAQAAHA